MTAAAAIGHAGQQLLVAPVERRKHSFILAIAGYTLLLILVYLVIQPSVSGPLAGLANVTVGAVNTWVTPEDPLAKLESVLGSGGTASSSFSSGTRPSGQSGSSGVAGGNPGGSSVGGAGPASWTPRTAPAPSTIKITKPSAEQQGAEIAHILLAKGISNPSNAQINQARLQYEKQTGIPQFKKRGVTAARRPAPGSRAKLQRAVRMLTP